MFGSAGLTPEFLEFHLLLVTFPMPVGAVALGARSRRTAAL